MSVNNDNELVYDFEIFDNAYKDTLSELDATAYKTLDKIKTTLENIRTYFKSRDLLLTQQWVTFEDWLNEFSIRDPNK